MARVISFVNQKGGTGKTTICINLAAGLAHFNKKVLIIDMDFQCNATTGLGIERENVKFSTFDLIKNENLMPFDIMQNTYLDNLKLIPASFELKHLDLLADNSFMKNIALKLKIDKIKKDFDFILIDNPPSISSIVYNSLFASDSVYIPVEMSYFGLEGLDMVENSINIINDLTIKMRDKIEASIGKTDFDLPPKYLEINGVIINRWDSITRISREIESILKDRYKDKLFNTKIRNNTTIKEAIGEGISIIDYAPSSNGAEDFIKLTREVIERESEKQV